MSDLPVGELAQVLRRLLAAEAVAVYEDGRRVPGFEAVQFELHGEQRPMLHLWSGDRSLVRRILRVEILSEQSICLCVERFGRSRPSRLEIVRRDVARSPRRVAIERFLERFAQQFQQRFPDETLRMLTAAADLEHSLPGNYVRGWSSHGQQAWAILAVPPEATKQATEAALAIGLLWFHLLRRRAMAPLLVGLRLVVPAGRVGLIVHRVRALRPDLRLELYQSRPEEALLESVDLADRGNLRSRLMPAGVAAGLLAEVAELDRMLRSLAPEAITAVALPATREVAWRFRGLEFARWRRGQLRFGVEAPPQPLAERNWPELVAFVHQLATWRTPRPSDRHHPLFRAARERWLEAQVLAEVRRVDPELDPARIHQQVLVLSGTQRGVVDLLGVRADGRLAILELKADESLHLVFQAVDYWLCLRQHQLAGDLVRLGYVTSQEQSADPPLLYLVAPALRFHPATDTLLQYLSPEIPVCCVGVNEAWRERLEVVWRRWRPSSC